MKKIWLFAFVAIFLNQSASASQTELPSVTHYSLQLRLFPKQERVEAGARMTVTNKTHQAFSEVPFLLYRLLDVQKVTDDKGSPLTFNQTITRFTEADVNNLQVNLIKIQLRKPLLPGAASDLVLIYTGSIYGYAEVWAYVKDRIGEQYSLFRPDALAYPMLAQASRASLNKAYGLDTLFTYDLTVTVPAGHVVACGGAQQNVSTKDDLTTFVFGSKIPTWRIDIAIANFKQLKDEAKQLAVYVLSEDEKTAANILNGVSKAVSLYSVMFGELKDYQGYTVIEIPDGWGSQASDYYVLETAAAFRDPKRILEVYHEVAHSWNAKVKPEVKRTRWFDEAFAMYFQAIALREFEGEEAYEDEMDHDRESFIKRVQSDKRNFDTPIAEYGKSELGGNSYSKGAWSLYVLHQLVGEKQFKQIIRRFLSDFRNKPADFKDFQLVAERVSHRDLGKYFNEWIYGAASSQLLLDKVPVNEIIKRY
ncbi:MAG TPA: M1 family aminopeptidase [Acidobacteriota bacterium]|jgi:aminopeptidase N|nr:M1 family aminopeptidase [Acidobacteriota bacterium]